MSTEKVPEDDLFGGTIREEEDELEHAAASLSIPYRNHLFHKNKSPVLHIQPSSLLQDEVFLILVFIYSETKRQDKTVSLFLHLQVSPFVLTVFRRIVQVDGKNATLKYFANFFCILEHSFFDLSHEDIIFDLFFLEFLFFGINISISCAFDRIYLVFFSFLSALSWTKYHDARISCNFHEARVYFFGP